MRDEPGCLRFDVCSVEGDEHRFVLYELYADAAAFAAHKAAPHFAEWRTVPSGWSWARSTPPANCWPPTPRGSA